MLAVLEIKFHSGELQLPSAKTRIVIVQRGSACLDILQELLSAGLDALTRAGEEHVVNPNVNAGARFERGFAE